MTPKIRGESNDQAHPCHAYRCFRHVHHGRWPDGPLSTPPIRPPISPSVQSDTGSRIPDLHRRRLRLVHAPGASADNADPVRPPALPDRYRRRQLSPCEQSAGADQAGPKPLMRGVGQSSIGLEPDKHGDSIGGASSAAVGMARPHWARGSDSGSTYDNGRLTVGGQRAHVAGTDQ